MRWTSSSFIVLSAIIAPLTACNAPEAPGEESTAFSDDAIKGGKPATDYPEAVLLEMKQNGQLKEACSGSLIAPQVVLTAGHCAVGFDSWHVRAPFAGAAPQDSTDAATFDYDTDSQQVEPSQHDVALIFLSTPIVIPTYPTIASSALAAGQQVVNVGRINNGQLSNSALYVSKPITVQSASSLGYTFDYMSNQIIEPGDSGGPDFVAGTHTLIAVNSGGGQGTELLARVDLVASWIQQQIASHGGGGGNGGSGGAGGGGSGSSSSSSSGGGPINPPGGGGWPGWPNPACGPLGFIGTCNGNQLVFCDSNGPHHTNCGAQGKQCGKDPFRGYYTCL
jgi:Trypsin